MTLPDNVKLGLELVGIDNASTTVDKASNSINKYADSAEQAGNRSEDAARRTKMSWTELQSVFGLAEQAAQYAKRAWEETAGTTVELANTVRQFRDVTGQSAEESSRLVQVLDDYKVSVSAAEMATKKFSKDGLEFNVSVLADLSDKYLKLNTDVERTQFLYDQFGKSGDEFAEIMKQGGQAIREANDAISENLILTDKQLQAARNYEIALDNTSDAITGLKVAIGNELLPIGNDLLKVIQKQIDAGLEWQDLIGPLGLIDNFNKLKEAQFESKLASMDMAEGMKETASVAEDFSTSIDDSTISIEELSAANEKYLSTIGDVSKEIDSYKDKEEDLKEKHADLLAEKQTLISQGWSAESEAVQAVNDKLAENEEAQAENVAAFDEATKVRMLAMLQEQLAVDGLSAKESAFLLEQGMKWGIYSQEAVDAMAATQRQVDAMERNIDININVRTNYSESGQAALSNQLAGEKDYVPDVRRSNALGGQYMIPESAGNERFPIGSSDTASGGEILTITPKNKNPNADIIAALYATRADENKIARAVTEFMLQERR